MRIVRLAADEARRLVLAVAWSGQAPGADWLTKDALFAGDDSMPLVALVQVLHALVLSKIGELS